MTTRSTPAAGRDDRPRLRLKGPGDLVHMVPYLLGFRPRESLVVVGLSRGLIVVTVRIDLADVLADVLADTDTDTAAAGGGAGPVLAGTVETMVRGGAQRLVGFVFDDRADPYAGRPGDLPWGELPGVLAEVAAGADAEVDDVLLVSNRRWWSYRCGDPRCCPPEGTAVDESRSSVPAQAAYAGLVALPDREALAELLEPEPSRTVPVAVVDEAARPWSGGAGERALRAVKRALFTAAREAQPPHGTLPDDSTAIRFAAALSAIAVRDAAWLAIDDGRLDGRELWRMLGRRMPGRYAAAPLFLFGWASWRDGNGALAGMAAARAIQADPDYSAADLLQAAVTRGLDPRQVPRLRRRIA